MKNSLLYLRENLMWTSTGTVWAMWRVHGLPYGFGKGEHKERAMLAHQALFQGLRGEAMLMGLCAELDPAAVVERMLDGVDLEQCPNYPRRSSSLWTSSRRSPWASEPTGWPCRCRPSRSPTASRP